MFVDLRCWLLLQVVLCFSPVVCGATTVAAQNATANSTQKDRRYAFENDYDIFPLPPARPPAVTIRPLQDLGTHAHSSLSPAKDLNPEPTIKSKGHPSEAPPPLFPKVGSGHKPPLDFVADNSAGRPRDGLGRSLDSRGPGHNLDDSGSPRRPLGNDPGRSLDLGAGRSLDNGPGRSPGVGPATSGTGRSQFPSPPPSLSIENLGNSRETVSSSSEASFRLADIHFDEGLHYPLDLSRRPLLQYHEQHPPKLASAQDFLSPHIHPGGAGPRSSTPSSTIIPGSKSSPPIYYPSGVSSSSSSSTVHTPALLDSLVHQGIGADYLDASSEQQQQHHHQGGPSAEVVNNHHMPLISSVDVQCSVTAMHVLLKFDGPFGGVVYSKGFFNDPKCHYVPFGMGLSSYEFVIAINRCGAQFVDFTPGGQASLEDIIVVQNERSIQEIWDTARRLQCTWAGTFEKRVNSAFHVDMLETVAVTYSADQANAYMDIQLGKGPFAAPVTGLVKIGDTITVVIAVEAPGDIDVRVKECVAHNGDKLRQEPQDDGGFHGNDGNNVVRLTDTDGCVLKPKLMSPWHKTRDTGKTGANVLTYSYLQAFKFPDRMEVYLECSLEICKQHCQDRCRGEEDDDRSVPPYSPGRLLQRRRRKRREASGDDGGGQSAEELVLQRTLRVVSPDDLSLLRNSSGGLEVTPRSSGNAPPSSATATDVCLSIAHFAVTLVVIFFILVASCVTTGVIAVRRGHRRHLINKASIIEKLTKTPVQ